MWVQGKVDPSAPSSIDRCQQNAGGSSRGLYGKPFCCSATDSLRLQPTSWLIKEVFSAAEGADGDLAIHDPMRLIRRAIPDIAKPFLKLESP